MEKSGNITVVKANDNYEKVHISAIKNLSAEELGIYVKIMSFGTQWSLNINGLTSVLGISKERVRKAIVKLEKEGYIVRKAVREDNGKMAGWDYFVYPYPVEEKDRSCAGKATTQESDNTLFQLDEKPCCRKTNNTETREDNIYRLEEITDYNKQQTNKNKENNDKSLLKESANNITWRNDFDTYMSLVNSGKEKLIENAAYRQCMEECYPNIDYDKTIYKLVEGHWGTVDGWEWCKKHRKTKSLDFYATLKNGIDNRRNIVYKPISQGYRQTYQQPQKTEPYAEELSKPITLQDGTLFNQGIRFYNSKVTNNVVIVPTNAPNRPLGEDWEWDDRYGWYENK